ncbi:PAS domain-containing sensor histidine kinase [Labilibaculum sp.]|uniref:PAS domain-containing sensor histidine kinase n=1 Tax=Labilibaculum sp. TaxID=2060723 RepID=UPI00356526DB
MHSTKEERPWNIFFNEKFRETIKKDSQLNVEIFVENLDLLQYRSEAYKDLIAQTLEYKYGKNLPDILIVTEPDAVRFAHERKLFPEIPKILIVASKKEFQNYPNSIFLLHTADYKAKLKHAFSIFPDTKEVYVITGSSGIDHLNLNHFKKVVPFFQNQVSFTYLFDLNRSEILNRVQNLPENSIVYYLAYTQDIDGSTYMAKDFSVDLAKNSNRPVFSYLDLITEGTGIFGGMVLSLQSTAEKTVNIVGQLLRGNSLQTISVDSASYTYIYDWRELKKWNASIRKLPKESIICNREYSFFEMYKKEVIGGVFLLISYTTLLFMLLYSNRSKRIKEKKLIKQNEEYEELNLKFKSQNDLLRIEKLKSEEGKNMLNTLINTIPDLVWLKDVNGRFLTCNNRIEDLYGRKKEKIIGTTDYDYVDKELADYFRQNDKAAMKAGRPVSNEEKLTFISDGHKEIIEAIKTPLFNSENEVVGVLGIGRDITQRVQAEKDILAAKDKAEESDRLKSAFLANMSHEIRTPMNGIIGFADLLKNPNLSESKKLMYVDIIEKSGLRMLNLINNIVDISKIEVGLMEVYEDESNVNDQVDYVYSFFELEAERKGLQLKVKKNLPENQAIITIDREKIYAILINLIKNAIKYTSKGSIEFGYERKGSELEFFVKDTGMGISKNRQEAIFERFIQADIEDVQFFEGAGLGLSISKAYVELLGGKIYVQSEEGKGSVFYFTVPYRQVSL